MNLNEAKDLIRRLLAEPLETKTAWLMLDQEDRNRLYQLLFDRQSDLDQIRNLGTIEVIPQETDPDYQGKVPHTPATLRMDRRGRDRLIAALIEGCDQVTVYDEVGEGYSLLLESIDEN